MNFQEAISVILKELDVQKKPSIGSGSDKVVYELKSNPNYIVKTARESIIKIELKATKLYPDLFAKIIKVNLKKGWMIQEKLSTKQFQNNLLSLIPIVKEYKKEIAKNYPSYARFKNYQKELEEKYGVGYKNIQLTEQEFDRLYDLKRKYNNDMAFTDRFFKEFNTDVDEYDVFLFFHSNYSLNEITQFKKIVNNHFINQLVSFFEKVDDIQIDNNFVDLGVRNIGMDQNGNIKLLDF